VKREKSFDHGDGCGGMDVRVYDGDTGTEVEIAVDCVKHGQASYFMSNKQLRELRDALNEALGEGSKT
jgi:hypothetical protein